MINKSKEFQEKWLNRQLTMGIFGRDLMMQIRENEKNSPRPLTQQQIFDLGLDFERMCVRKAPTIQERVLHLLGKVTQTGSIDYFCHQFASFNVSFNENHLKQAIDAIEMTAFCKPEIAEQYAEIFQFQVENDAKMNNFVFRNGLRRLVDRFLDDEQFANINGMVLIGHLYLKNVLSNDFLPICFSKLLDSNPIDDESIQRGIKFMRTIGFENHCLDKWLDKLKIFEPLVFKETRCMIRDLMEFKENEKSRLRTTRNAWKPDRQKGKIVEKNIHQKARFLLNRVTNDTLSSFIEQFDSLNVSSNDANLKKVISIILNKSMEDPTHSKLYASICRSQIDANNPEMSEFRKKLLSNIRYSVLNERSSEDESRRINLLIFIKHLLSNEVLKWHFLRVCYDSLFEAMDDKSVQYSLQVVRTVGMDEKPNEWLKKMRRAAPRFSNRTRLLIMNLVDYFRKEEENSAEEKVCRKVRFLLNRVSFDTLSSFKKQFITYDVSSTTKLAKKVVKTVFSQMICSARYSWLYAQLCKEQVERNPLFREVFHSHCQAFINKMADVEGRRGQKIHGAQFIAYLWKADMISQHVLTTACRLFLKSIVPKKVNGVEQPLRKADIDDDAVLAALRLIGNAGVLFDKCYDNTSDFLDGWFEQLTAARRFCSPDAQLQILELVEMRQIKLRDRQTLLSSPGAWKPERQREEISEDSDIQKTCQKVRFLLNRVTEKTLESLSKEFISYNVSSNEEILNEVVKLIINKAIEDTNNCALYTAICRAQVVHGQRKTILPAFYKVLVDQTHLLFEENDESKREADRKRIVFLGHLYSKDLINLSMFRRYAFKLLNSFFPDKQNFEDESIQQSVRLIEAIRPYLATDLEFQKWLAKLKEVLPFSDVKTRCLIMNLFES